jgi:hypothetical protein
LKNMLKQDLELFYSQKKKSPKKSTLSGAQDLVLLLLQMEKTEKIRSMS